MDHKPGAPAASPKATPHPRPEDVSESGSLARGRGESAEEDDEISESVFLARRGKARKTKDYLPIPLSARIQSPVKVSGQVEVPVPVESSPAERKPDDASGNEKARLGDDETDRLDSALDNLNMKPKALQERLRLVHSAVSDFVKTVISAGVNGLRKEFLELEMYQFSNYSHEVFRRNMERNRYPSNVCLDATRVVLEFHVPPSTDYINANWVLAPNVETAFIATQGPLDTTMEDFWRMCYQENVTTILMLCNVLVGCKQKCAQYWPPEEKSMKKFGALTVHNKKVTLEAGLETVSLELIAERVNNPLRCVELVHYTKWANAELPSSSTDLLYLIRRIQKKGPGPCVVHCSGGTGRTGTAITVAVIVERLFKGIHVKLNEVVYELRGMRSSFVVAESQYIFIASTVLTYIKAKVSEYDKEIDQFLREVGEIPV